MGNLRATSVLAGITLLTLTACGRSGADGGATSRVAWIEATQVADVSAPDASASSGGWVVVSPSHTGPSPTAPGWSSTAEASAHGSGWLGADEASAGGPGPSGTGPAPTQPPTTQPPATTQPPTTQTPATTQPPTTQPPTTQPPATTQPPTTQTPATTQPPTTQAPIDDGYEANVDPALCDAAVTFIEGARWVLGEPADHSEMITAITMALDGLWTGQSVAGYFDDFDQIVRTGIDAMMVIESSLVPYAYDIALFEATAPAGDRDLYTESGVRELARALDHAALWYAGNC